MVLDSVVDRCRGEDSVELACAGGGIVLSEDGFDDCTLGNLLALLGRILTVGLEVVDVKLQDVAIFNCVGNGVFVQALLEKIFSGLQRLLFTRDLLEGSVVRKDWRAGKAEELGLGEELLDGLVVLAKLRAVAFVEDKDNPFVPQRFELIGISDEPALFAAIVAFAVFVECLTELLDGADDDLIGRVIGQ